MRKTEGERKRRNRGGGGKRDCIRKTEEGGVREEG